MVDRDTLERIAKRLDGTDGSLALMLALMGAVSIGVRAAEKALEKDLNFGYCQGCKIWCNGVSGGLCRECQDEANGLL